MIAACAFVFGASISIDAHAQAVGVVRANSSVQEDLATSVDDALLRDLAGIANIRNPVVSPAAYDQIQLAVGCEDESRSCLVLIAQTLQVDALVISRLSSDETGITSLELTYFKESDSRQPVKAQATVSPTAKPTIVDAVPGLVRRLFGVPDPAGAPSMGAASSPRNQPGSEATSQPTTKGATQADIESQTEPDARENHIAPVTWAALITGTAVLGIGVGVGVSAKGDFEDLKSTPVRTVTDARRVHSDFDSITTRGTVANIMMPIGAAVLGCGVVLLIMDLTGHDAPRDRDSARLDVMPLRGGAGLVFHSPFEGG